MSEQPETPETPDPDQLTAIEIIATVSHELRSPLTSIKGFTSLLLSRWDGKEFLLMLSNTRASLGRLSLERLRERVHGLMIEAPGEALHMSFSAGVTEHRAGETVADTVQRAEQGLVTAKAGGANRVVLA